MTTKVCNACKRSPKNIVWIKCSSCKQYLCNKTNCNFPCSTCEKQCCPGTCINRVVSDGGFHCLVCIKQHNWKLDDTKYESFVD